MQNKLTIIGRNELIDFPNLSINQLEVKVDTGAYTSSLHCSKINVDKDVVHFIPLEPNEQQYQGKEFTFPIVEMKSVKSSNGQVEERCTIKTHIKLGQKEFDIYLTLTDRSDMKFPVLLGRKFLTNKFLVDVSKRHNLK